ncbi:CRISPR-associated endonuclease Cas1 [soil metagenome]
MPTACIQYPGTRVSLESEHLELRPPEGEGAPPRRDIPLRDIDRVILSESVSITSPALAALVRRGIPVSLMAGRGRFLGSFLPATPDHGAARIRQYQRPLEPEFALPIAGRIIAAKIYNQRRLIQRVAANRRAAGNTVTGHVPEALDHLDRLLAATSRAPSIPVLRGLEGTAAASYFAAWASLFPPEFPFVRRSTRPPLNPVNAALSFSATLVYNEMHAAIHARGLDAALGLLHTTENGRWSLALDLMEPFRPVVAEALTLDLFSHRILNAEHFESRGGGIYLNATGRAKHILQYEKRMGRQFMSESAGHRTTLRQQLENQAALLKSGLDDPTVFEPFLMN